MTMRRRFAAALCLALSISLLSFPAGADGQIRRAQGDGSRGPLAALAAANAASRQHPSRASFEHARQIYVYQPGAIFLLYANPSYVSTILLEPGEIISNIAAGDTSRWMVTQAQGDDDGRTIVLVKPRATKLRTNIVLITDRRTYLIEAVSQAGSAYCAQMAWTYPQGAEAAPSTAHLNFNYRIHRVRGRTPVWTPVRVYDDGRRTWIEFAESVAASDLPPLFVISADGAELVNYRVQARSSGQRYMVDRVFDVAELRLGTRAKTVVRIERKGQPRAAAFHPGPHG